MVPKITHFLLIFKPILGSNMAPKNNDLIIWRPSWVDHFSMFFSTSLWGLAFGAWVHFSITQHENLDSVLFFYSTFALWEIFENVFFWSFLAVFVSPLSWLARGAWVTFLVMFWSCKRKILISYCFLQHFGAAGTSWNGFFFRLFCFFCEFYVLASMWLVFDAWMLFSVTQHENLDFVLFFTAFWSRRHLSKRCLF